MVVVGGFLFGFCRFYGRFLVVVLRGGDGETVRML